MHSKLLKDPNGSQTVMIQLSRHDLATLNQGLPCQAAFWLTDVPDRGLGSRPLLKVLLGSELRIEDRLSQLVPVTGGAVVPDVTQPARDYLAERMDDIEKSLVKHLVRDVVGVLREYRGGAEAAEKQEGKNGRGAEFFDQGGAAFAAQRLPGGAYGHKYGAATARRC